MSEATHILQAKVEKLAHELWQIVGGQCPISVIAFYGDNVSATGNTFVTTLDLNELASTAAACVLRLELAEPELFRHQFEAWLPDDAKLRELGAFCRVELPFSVQFVLLCGRVHYHRFVSYLSRDEARQYLANVFIPHLTTRQVVAPQDSQ